MRAFGCATVLCAVFAAPPCTRLEAQQAPSPQGSAAMQMPARTAHVRSTHLTLILPDGSRRDLTPEQLLALPQQTVTVVNGHTHEREVYSGPSVVSIVGRLSKPLTTVLLAQGTDGYRVALAACDADPACRSGEAIVALKLNGQPLEADGALKLILSEDKMPRRWVRNLTEITVQQLAAGN